MPTNVLQQVKALAKWSGAEAADVTAGLALHDFPTPQQQASLARLGGGAAKSLATAALLKSRRPIDAPRDGNWSAT